jgi:hypothetical protein
MLVLYDPATGIFYCRTPKTGRGIKRKVGDPLGWKHPKGYIIIESLPGFERKFKAHRLAWLYMKGEWPTSQIDHINQRKDDNRFENLREATDGQNKSNNSLRPDNKAGVTGVCYVESTGRWRAYCTVDGKQWSKYFQSKGAAIAARKAMIR